jgi:uncharacterized membrane protein
MELTRRYLLHIFFRVMIFFKGIDGIVETLGGIVLASVSSQAITNFVYSLFGSELLEPDDFLTHYLVRLLTHLSVSTHTFAVVFLLGHGLVKFGLATCIWFNKLWAYPLAGVILSLFVIYQVIRFGSTHSVLLLLITAVDIIIIAMLRPEYKQLLALKHL